jgi:molybdenum cofactor cytidylyltransferase
VAVASQRVETENKLRGIDSSLVAGLAGLADAVIVEADGAKQRSLKAPAAHEPVIASETTLLIPVVGIDVIGQRLSEETAHRPDLVAEVTGQARGAIITASMLASLLVHPQGALKGAPDAARVAPLINKVHGSAALAAGREIARSIKGNAALDRVLLGAVAGDNPIAECWRPVSAVVLAAGASKRFGRPKLLLPVAGRTMIEHVLHVVSAAGVDEVVVVLGHSAARIAAHIPLGCRTVLNDDWKTGISSSVRAGLEAIDRRAKAALFVPADQPRITIEGIDRVLQAYYGSIQPIVVPVYRRRRGTPVLFDRRLFPALRALQGDVGGRQVLSYFSDEILAVEMQSPETFLDVDTPADYEEFLRAHERTEADDTCGADRNIQPDY